MGVMLDTERGLLTAGEFRSGAEAMDNGYSYWFTSHTSGKRKDIYTKDFDGTGTHFLFGYVVLDDHENDY